MTRGGQCRIFPGNCHWSDHSTLPYWFKHSTKTVDEVALSKKAAAEAAAEGISNTEAILREQRDKYVASNIKVMENIMMVHQIINHLRKIALRRDLLDADDHVQAMIDSELQSKRPGFRARVEAIQNIREESKLLRDVCDGQTNKRIENMDHALHQIDDDIKLASKKYEESLKKVQRNDGKGRGWGWRPISLF